MTRRPGRGTLPIVNPRRRQHVALLLASVLALLPMQGLLAALWQPAAPAMHHHTGMPDVTAREDGTAGSLYDRHHMAAMPDCPMHHPGADGAHCNGGCDMCGVCGAVMLPLPELALTRTADQPIPATQNVQPSEPSYVLFRPPRG